MNAPFRPIRLSDDEFERFVATGGAASLGRVELREGVLVRMSPQHLLHGRTKFWLAKEIERAIAAAGLRLFVDVEITVRFDNGFAPMPDVALWTGGPLKGPIPGGKAKLAVEVSDETLEDDLGSKRAEYAKAGLPEYWVLDVNARALHRFHAPEEDRFAKADIFRAGETVETATLPGVSILLDLPA